MLSVQVFKPSRIELIEIDEILVLEFPQEIPVGQGLLTIEFEGILNDRMKGFYRRYVLLWFVLIDVIQAEVLEFWLRLHFDRDSLVLNFLAYSVY